jgi:hypothetical protein
MLMENELTPATPDLDTGAWIGRQQAFALIANKCSAAQASSLKQMRESGCYEKLGLTWEDFCRQHTGISRSQADRLISQYDEFGEAYFRLSSLARISVEDYRQIAPQVAGNCIDIDGEQVPIIPENAARIRAFVRVRRPRPPAFPPPFPAELSDFKLRQRALVADFKRQIKRDLHDDTRAYLKYLFEDGIQDWKELLRYLIELNPKECHFEPRDPPKS